MGYKTTVGTCGKCGGRVSVPTDWMATVPPKPTCERCGATARENHGPTIAMEGGRDLDGWMHFPPLPATKGGAPVSSVPMPRDLSEEAVAMWLWDVSSIEGDLAWDDANSPSKEQAFAAARAVRALLREKVREAVTATAFAIGLKSGETTNSIVARVLGDHPQGGHDEGRPARGEAPRG